MKVQIEACKCNQCGYVWLPNEDNPDPVSCSKCKSPYWNRQKKNRK